jgi:hypothetical protein
MKKLAILLALVSTSVFAGSIEAGYDFKNKVNSIADHSVYSLQYNTAALVDGLALGVKTENETVKTTDALEGLIQGQAKYSIATGTMFTPFVNTAVGQKFKNGNNFSFWLGGVGVKAALTDKVSLETAWRRREAFDSVNNYNTDEYSVKAAYEVAQNHIVGVKYARERGTSDYNTTGAFYQFKF